jgi:hypothetical protein
MYKVRIERIDTSVPGNDAEGIMIGGFDHNFPRVADYSNVINGFLTRVLVRWPSAVIFVDDDPRGTRLTLHKHDVPATLPAEGVALIVRDGPPEGEIEPTSDNESPLVLWFHPVNGAHYLDLVTVGDPLENEFCWWAVEQLWDVYLKSKQCETSNG